MLIVANAFSKLRTLNIYACVVLLIFCQVYPQSKCSDLNCNRNLDLRVIVEVLC